MPHKLVEADEKMGCEVETYAWMQEKCLYIRIPLLCGFGFYDRRHIRTVRLQLLSPLSHLIFFIVNTRRQQYTYTAYRPLHERILRRLQRLLYRLLGCLTLISSYIRHPTTHRLPTAYMLLEYVSSDIS